MPTPPDDVDSRLVRLLALKRREVPPPCFFEHLPRRILASIRAGSEIEEVSWWRRLVRTLAHEPMAAGAYAALGVGALLFGTSVFQMALDSEAPAPTMLEGMLLSTDAPVAMPSHLPGGAIYRVVPGELEFIEVIPASAHGPHFMPRAGVAPHPGLPESVFR